MAATYTGASYLSTTSVPGGLNQNSANFSASIWVYVTSNGGSIIDAPASGAYINVVGSTVNGSGQYNDSIGIQNFQPDGHLYFEQETTVFGQLLELDGGVMTLNAWTHLAMTFNGTAIVGYVNGASVGTSSGPTATAIAWNRIVVGGFNGDAQDAWLFNRVLAAAEVAHLYRRRNPTISTTSLVGHWPGAADSRTVDTSGNGRTLTATGTVSAATRSAPVPWQTPRASVALRR